MITTKTIKDVIIDQGYSIDEFAIMVKIKKRTLYARLADQKTFRFKELEAIAAALDDVNVAQLQNLINNG